MRQFQQLQNKARAVRFIMEQNRLLQKDNAALIGMVKRQGDELAELKAPKKPTGKGSKKPKVQAS